MRLFVGIPLTGETRARIARACASFRDISPAWADDKWVPEANLHVTLKFLGDVAFEQVEPIVSALAEACSGVEPFELRLDRLQAVPSAKRATMLWVRGSEGEEGRCPACAALALRVDDALAPLGFEPEQRAFKAHVTLVRTRRPRQVTEEALQAAEAELRDGMAEGGRSAANSMSVRSVTLYRSQLGGIAPIYEPLAEVDLGSN